MQLYNVKSKLNLFNVRAFAFVLGIKNFCDFGNDVFCDRRSVALRF